MPATTPLGVPYPLGTDRVSDGDNAIQSLAQWVDSSICFGAAYTVGTGPGVGGSIWFNSTLYAQAGGCTLGGTFPVTGIKVPRKGWYQIHAVAGDLQVSQLTGASSSRLFIGDSATPWVMGFCTYAQVNASHSTSCMQVVQLSAGQTVFWGMSNYGPNGGGVYENQDKNTLLVRLLCPLP